MSINEEKSVGDFIHIPMLKREWFTGETQKYFETGRVIEVHSTYYVVEKFLNGSSKPLVAVPKY